MPKKLILLTLLVMLLVAFALTFPIKAQGKEQVTRIIDLISLPAVNAEEQATQLPADVLVIINGSVIDGSGHGPIAVGLVAIQGDRILAVGPTADFVVPAEAQIIDAQGRTIMPGIINAHVHNTHSPGTRGRFLAAGVTSTCDMATSLNDMAHFAQTTSEQGQAVARGFKSGPMITAPGGYPDGFRWDYQVSTPQEATAATNDLLDRGADMVKIALEPGLPHQSWPTLTAEQIEAVVETAHARGAPVRAHVQQASMLDAALQAGVDAIEHVPLPFPEEMKLAQMQPEERLSLSDYPALEQQLRAMVAQNIVLVPTLNVGTCATRGVSALETPQRRHMCDFQLEVVGYYHRIGGMVALGNDYGNIGIERGMPLREMELLLAAGLSPMEVIKAGTHNAAQVCGQTNDLGVLEAGKRADLLILDGNPLNNLYELARISRVIQDGEIAYHYPLNTQ